MTRLIDADIFVETLTEIDPALRDMPVKLIVKAIEITPKVDAVPVRHGQWIPCAKSGLTLTEQLRKEGVRWYGFKCSACNFVRKGNAPREANYCECCGAMMDAEREEHEID